MLGTIERKKPTLSAEAQVALQRMALRLYDACLTGHLEQPGELFDKLARAKYWSPLIAIVFTSFGHELKSVAHTMRRFDSAEYMPHAREAKCFLHRHHHQQWRGQGSCRRAGGRASIASDSAIVIEDDWAL
jgi:hypothetical protein